MRLKVLLPSHAGRLRGKLQFACSSAFGRYGRAQLAALKRRQYRHAASTIKDYSLTPQLEATLVWWLALLGSLPPRGVPPSPSSRHLVGYSDGEGSGGVAACLTFIDGSTEYCCTQVPASILQRWVSKRNIHRIEAFGPLLTFLTWGSTFKGKLLLFFTDNKSALSSMVGGWSNEEYLNDISSLTWHLACKLNVFVFCEWVDPAANIIDAASRAKTTSDHDVYQARGWKRVDPVTPWSLLFPDAAILV